MNNSQVYRTKTHTEEELSSDSIIPNIEDYYSDYQYTVSIKEDTAYPCLHSQRNHKGKKINTLIREDNDSVLDNIACEIQEDIKRDPYSRNPDSRIQPIGYAIILIRASRLKKIPYEVMAELIYEEYIMNAQNESNLSITYNDINIELSKEFLVELHKNAYHRWIDEDMMDHIAKVLEMIDLIYIPGVDSHQLRMKIFPLSLANDARQWWINEGEEKITV
ncbi:hypothetical protein Tco_0850734 [Tanacetum coccineum]